MRKITEETLIPISMAVILLGGVAWLTTLYNQSAANAKSIEALAGEITERDKALEKIWQELFQIKGELKRIRR